MTSETHTGRSSHATQLRHRGGVLAALAVLSLLAGCVGKVSDRTKSGVDSAGGTSSQPYVVAANKAVSAGYHGKFVDSPTTGPVAVRGKSVWWLSCGSQYDSCNLETTYFKQAAALLGWRPTIFDTKGDPTRAAAGIRQAVASKADGIMGQGQDCTSITSALEAARAAKIPVTQQLASDCDPPLFASPFNYGGAKTEAQWTDSWASTEAQYLISKLNGKAKIINLAQQDLIPTQEINKDFLAAFAKCRSCKVVAQVDFIGSDIPAKMLAKVQTALTQHPEANALVIPYDALMTLGLQPLIQRSGHNLAIVGGGQGQPANVDLIRQGKQDFALAFPYKWLVWAQADNMNRILAGRPPVQQGGGFQFVDKAHNLPPSGPYVPSYDFEATYKKIWSGS